MSTFEGPATDADEAREALRALAHTTHRIADPREVYRVLGGLSAGLLSLQQSLDQLASWHEQNAEHAVSEDGSRAVGIGDARVAEEHLREAAGWVRQAHCELREAFNHHGRIVWKAPAPARARLAEPAAQPARSHATRPQTCRDAGATLGR